MYEKIDELIKEIENKSDDWSRNLSVASVHLMQEAIKKQIDNLVFNLELGVHPNEVLDSLTAISKSIEARNNILKNSIGV